MMSCLSRSKTDGAEPARWGAHPALRMRRLSVLWTDIDARTTTGQLRPGSIKFASRLRGAKQWRLTQATLLSRSPRRSLTPPPSPLSEVQLIVPSATAVSSNEKVTFGFAFPPHALKGSLYFSCPYGVTASIPNVCNAYTDVTSYAASTAGYAVAFSNSASKEQTV